LSGGQALLALALGTAVLLSAPTLSAQVESSDPRDAVDPRSESSDPRDKGDPRQADVDFQAGVLGDELDGADLFDHLHEKGELAGLSTAIRDEPWELLAYLDSLCEQWIGMVESGDLATPDGLAAADALSEKLEQFARLGDEGLGDTAFEAWVGRVTAWDTEEIATYREAQALYVEGVTLFNEATTPEHALEALTPLRRALSRLQLLGPTWESCMSLTLIGRVQVANGELLGAQETMQDALLMGRSLRDLDAVWNGLTILFQVAIHNGDYDGAEDLLAEQFRISLETGDQATANQVVDRLTQLTEFRDATGL
jgi:hypothetical protein